MISLIDPTTNTTSLELNSKTKPTMTSPMALALTIEADQLPILEAIMQILKNELFINLMNKVLRNTLEAIKRLKINIWRPSSMERKQKNPLINIQPEIQWTTMKSQSSRPLAPMLDLVLQGENPINQNIETKRTIMKTFQLEVVVPPTSFLTLCRIFQHSMIKRTLLC